MYTYMCMCMYMFISSYLYQSSYLYSHLYIDVKAIRDLREERLGKGWVLGDEKSQNRAWWNKCYLREFWGTYYRQSLICARVYTGLGRAVSLNYGSRRDAPERAVMLRRKGLFCVR